MEYGLIFVIYNVVFLYFIKHSGNVRGIFEMEYLL